MQNDLKVKRSSSKEIRVRFVISVVLFPPQVVQIKNNLLSNSNSI